MMTTSTMISANDLSFHVQVAGDPSHPVLFFLHGFPEFSGAWADVIAHLSNRFFCIAPDQRGYGWSAKPDGVKAYATGKLAADAAAMLSHFAPRARAVIGHDWGASVAYALSFARPDLMDKLIILNGAHPIPFQRALAAGGAQSAASQYFHDLRAADADAHFSAQEFEQLRLLFSKGMDMDWLAGQRLADYREAWGRPGAMTAMLNWYRATPLQVASPGHPLPQEQLIPLDPARLRVTVPHLLIWGARDTALLPETTEGLEDLCVDLHRAELVEADHWLHHQRPAEVSTLIREFCA
jgi:pimeloyl-ACP methyl ester carboxylesterase